MGCGKVCGYVGMRSGDIVMWSCLWLCWDAVRSVVMLGCGLEICGYVGMRSGDLWLCWDVGLDLCLC